MAKRSPLKRSASLSPEQMRAALRQLDRREADLKAFDLNSVGDHGDQSAEALRLQYNTTIGKIFGGEDTIEYERYSVWNFDRGPVHMRLDPIFGGRGGVDLGAVRDGYRKGIAEALSHIATIRKIFREELEDYEEDPTARITHAFGELSIHSDIAAAAGPLVDGGHYANAVEDACKALEALVQRLSGRPDLSGVGLMQTVFSANGPILKVADDLSTTAGQDEQRGTMHLFEGAIFALRNPRAHSLRNDDPERAIECIAFVSLLAKIAEAATRV